MRTARNALKGSGFDPSVQIAKIDLAKTYTGRFVEGPRGTTPLSSRRPRP